MAKIDEKINDPDLAQYEVKNIESARDAFIKESKLGMLSRPNQIKAWVPDFTTSSKEELEALGLEYENGRWYVPNRKYFPNPITDDSIVINYGKRPDGATDLGFCSKEEFSKIYAHKDAYEKGEIQYVDPKTISKGETIDAIKCATGEFTVAPEGASVKTNEGVVKIAPGRILIINESKNSIFVTDIAEMLKRYVPDSTNPASRQAFDLLKEFEEKKIGKTPEEISDLHKRLVSDYAHLERQRKTYKAYFEEASVETLRDDFEHASEIVAMLDEEISSRINSLSFSDRIQQAREVLREIMLDSALTPEQRDIKISFVKVHLLPKTNNHQHLKGSVPMKTVLERAAIHGFTPDQIARIKEAYGSGAKGFDGLDQFNNAYSTIGSPIRTPEDYRAAIESIIDEATRSGQLTVEIRCSVIGQRDSSGNVQDPRVATENILDAIDTTCTNLGEDAPKTGFTFLGYRGRDWKPEEVIEHARLAVEFAKKYPEKRFGFDIAGPEDTGYNPAFFKEAFNLIGEYNDKIKSGELKGEAIGVTVHAGETPEYNNGHKGNMSVEEALDMKVDRIGHGIQAISEPQTLERLRQSGATVEICGVCNISSIPINTRGMAIHPVQEFVHQGVSITLCTDNNAICGTNIIKEYALFLLTGHSELMNWNTVKEVAVNGIRSSFVPERAKTEALKLFEKRKRIIERLVSETQRKVDLEKANDLLNSLNKDA